MIFEIFQNGSDKVNRRLVIIEIAMTQIAVMIAGVQGLLPSQDWIPPQYVKPIAGLLALAALAIHALSLFFNKTASLYRATLDDAHTAQPKTETPKQ